MKKISAGGKSLCDVSGSVWPVISSVWRTDRHCEQSDALTASNCREWLYLCHPHTAGATPDYRMWTVLHYLDPSLAARVVVSSSQPLSVIMGSECREDKGWNLVWITQNSKRQCLSKKVVCDYPWGTAAVVHTGHESFSGSQPSQTSC